MVLPLTLFALVATLLGDMGTLVIMGCLSVFGYLAAGLIAVRHYTTEYSLTVTRKQGVMLGLFAGVTTGVAVVLVQYFLIVAGIIPYPMEMLSDSGTMDRYGSGLMTGFGALFGFVVEVVRATFFGGLFGLIGGAIGSSIWKRGDDEVIVV